MIIPAARRLQAVEEYYFSKKLAQIRELNQRGHDIINLGIGSPDLAPAPQVIETLQMAAARPDAHGYQGYKGVPQLRQAMATWYAHTYGVTLDPEQEILPLIGSKEGITHISLAFLNAADQVLIPNPGYPAYAAAARMAEAVPVEYQLSGPHWLPDLAALARQDLSRVKLMWLNYPHMPTGAVASPGFFAQVVAFARQHNILLCHDNPYSLVLNTQAKPLSLLEYDPAKEVVLELNSLSKSHNMAGWRVGMLAGAKPYIDTVLKVKSNVDSGTFLPMQLAAAVALALPDTWHQARNAVYARRRTLAYTLLAQLGCSVTPGQEGLFLWAALPPTVTDTEAFINRLLLEAGVFLTPGFIFGSAGQGYVRISLCATEARFAQALQRVERWGGGVNKLSLKD